MRRAALVVLVLSVLAFPASASAVKPQLLTVPGTVSSAATQTFEYSIANPIQYYCHVDAAPVAACGATAVLSGLADGAHTFEVKAYFTYTSETCVPDGMGGFNCTPNPPVDKYSEVSAYVFTIDRTKPAISFSGGTANKSSSKSRTVTFKFGAEAGSEFKCGLDGSTPEPCESPLTLGHRTPGAHKLTIQATDPAGNLGPLVTRVFGINTSRLKIKFISQTTYKRCVKKHHKWVCKTRRI
ncbi:MAG: hypothetical protein ACRDKI_00800 [Solirubrobacterales bacterium]